MAIFNIFHRPKPKKFGFIPRYYDPEKEAREAKLAQYKSNDKDLSSMKSRIRSSLRAKRGGDLKDVRKSARRSNLILFATLAGLLVLLYYAINRYLPDLVNLIEK